MLKHCHNSSIRLQRRGLHGGIHPHSVSLHSTLTLHSSTGSSESNTSDSSLLNASFSDPPVYSEDGMPPGIMATNPMYDRLVYAGTPARAPMPCWQFCGGRARVSQKVSVRASDASLNVEM